MGEECVAVLGKKCVPNTYYFHTINSKIHLPSPLPLALPDLGSCLRYVFKRAKKYCQS